MSINPYQQYRNNAVMTASRGELTLMLYNGALKFINQGIDDIKNGKINKAHNNIIKAQDIIEELNITLDKNYEVAKSIEELYIFIKELLVQANIHKDITRLEDARELVRDFRDMWQEVLKKVR